MTGDWSYLFACDCSMFVFFGGCLWSIVVIRLFVLAFVFLEGIAESCSVNFFFMVGRWWLVVYCWLLIVDCLRSFCYNECEYSLLLFVLVAIIDVFVVFYCPQSRIVDCSCLLYHSADCLWLCCCLFRGYCFNFFPPDCSQSRIVDCSLFRAILE